MKQYELTVLCAGTMSDSDVPSVWGRVQGLLGEQGAAEVQHASLGKIKLQYPIANNTHGHAATFLFSADPAAGHTIQQKLKLMTDVIRYAVEVYMPARMKKEPQIADTILLKASRREREKEKEEERGSERETRVDVPVFTASAPIIETQKAEPKEVNLEEIDKKLDELLAGDLTPTV